MLPVRGILCLLLLTWLVPASAQFPSFQRTARNTTARLILSHEIAKPGDTVLAGIELTMDEGWHTYWENGGDSGIPTTIHWDLPPTLSAGAIQWPVPEAFVDKELGSKTFVYHDRAVLVVPLTVSSSASAGSVEVKALAKWLECKIDGLCIPGSNVVSATLTVGTKSKPSAESATLAEAEKRLPSKTLTGTATAGWAGEIGPKMRRLVIEWSAAVTNADFFPYAETNATVSATTQVVSARSPVQLAKVVESAAGAWPKEIRGILVATENGATVASEVTLVPADDRSTVSTQAAGSDKSFALWLVYAFIGGLILNIMPCVLPVIALKILGFVQQSREEPRRVRTLGVMYTFGVVVSFLVLAGIVIAIKAAGQKAGWGIQFSNPQFLVLLTVIVTLVALNLFGVFEITLGGKAMTSASEAASRHGTAGAFMNGVLATILTTPCTAPFLGAALGFAFVQPAPVIVLFFVTIALGLAFPYLLLSWNPRLLKFLPKPGAWMERFKVAMGFPMLATAVWLLSLTESFFGRDTWWLGLLLVIIATAAWIFGTFVQRGASRRGIAIGLALVLILFGGWWVLEQKLAWRSPKSAATENSLALAPKGYDWKRWSIDAVEKGRGQGRPIIVDFTARWCATCNAIVKPALAADSVTAKLKELNALALLADYTRFPPEIGAELEKFGRAGVPLVLVYPRDTSKPTIVLPEAITSGMVVNALTEAAK